jgi:diguanylate cyclase (GGDEF)-like protein/PAS domain S-box-containing protein
LISPDPTVFRAVQAALGDEDDDGFALEWTARLADGVDRLSRGGLEAVVFDLSRPAVQGFSAFEQVSRAAVHRPILVIGSADTQDLARAALKRGAQDDLERSHLDSYTVRRAVRHAIERSASERDLVLERRRAEVTLNSIGDAVLSTDLAGRVTYLNPVAERMTGWTQQDACGRPVAEVCRLLDGDTRQPARNPLEMSLQLQKLVGLTPHCLLVRRDGFETAIEDSAAPIQDAAGHVIGAVMVFHDVSVARALALRATHLAQHDFLTELPNRMLLNDRMTQAMAIARRHGHHVAVLFVDLDQFKNVNDTLGHAIGDAVLQSVAQRLLASVRGADTVSRVGGDEFVVLLSEVHDRESAAATSRKIMAALAAPHHILHHHLLMRGSVGIGLYPDDGADPETLIRKADAAMYRAKESSRGLSDLAAGNGPC